MERELSREEAIRILHPDTAFSEYLQYDTRSDIQDSLWNKRNDQAHLMAIEALMPWKRTMEKPPGPNDANEGGFILGGSWHEGKPETFVYCWETVAADPYVIPYWMSIPPLPKKENS